MSDVELTPAEVRSVDHEFIVAVELLKQFADELTRRRRGREVLSNHIAAMQMATIGVFATTLDLPPAADSPYRPFYDAQVKKAHVALCGESV